MTFIYSYPTNVPTTSVRLYRFPYHGERSSERLNLLLQSIHGDLKLIFNILSDCSGISMDGVGGKMMQEQDKTQFSS